MDRFVQDAHRITDSATTASRFSRSPAPMVWFLRPLPTAPRDDGFALIATPLRAASAILLRAGEEEAAVTSSQGAPFSSEVQSPNTAAVSGSSDPCVQKNEKLGIDTTGNGKTAAFFLGSGLSPNENPETAQDAGGALAAMNAE